MGYYKVRINVKDQNNEPVVGSKVTLTKGGVGQGYPNSFTDSSGNAYFYDVVSDIQFKYTAYSPSGYSCVVCSKYHTVRDKDIWTQMEMKKAAAPNYDLHVLCRDENNNNLQNVAITINNVHRGYTSSVGTFSVSLPGDQQYDVKGVKSGYENGFGSIYLSSSEVVNLTLESSVPFVCSEGDKKDYESCFDGTHVYKTVCRDNEWIPTGDACPEEGTLDCFCDIQVTDENDNNLNCKVCVPGAEGPDCQQTGTDGITTFQLRRGTRYTATASKDGYIDYGGFSSRSFTTPNNTSDFLALRLTRKPTTCPDVDAKFTIHATWYNDAQTEIKVNEEVVVKDASSSDREIVSGEVDWGDGAVSQLDYSWWSAPGVKEARHTYVVPGEYTIVYTATNECESSDTQSFHITVLSEEELLCTISAAANVNAGDTFIATINCDPYQSFEVKIREGLIHKTIGVGDTNSSGVAKISCVIDEPGQYYIYGYDKGSILPGGFATSDFLINVRGVDIVDDRLALVVPSIAIAGEIELSGTAPPGEIVEIVHDKKWALNPILIKTVSDKDGAYTATITVEEFGAIDVYARIKKEGWLGIDILEKDMVSETHTIWVITTPILLGLVAILALIAEKKYGFIGVFK